MAKKLAIIGIRGFPGVQGGVEKHCESLMPLLAKDFELRVYRRKAYLTDESDKQYDSISFVDLPSSKIKGVEALVHTFMCCIHLAFHRVDIVNVHNIGPGLFTPFLRLLGLKVVLTYHSPNYEHSKWGRLSKLLLRLSEFIALRFSNAIIFVNKFQMMKYSEDVVRKSYYIPNGIRFKTDEEDRSTDFLSKHGIIAGEYVLAVGRLTPEKGFEYLVEAVNKLPSVKQLVIAGASDHDTTYFDSLKMKDHGKKVIFTGYTDGAALSQLYSNARLFVLSSINEGFPLVLLEAMNYGLPLVVSDIPATHLVNLSPDDYVKAGDSDSLADVIERKYADGVIRMDYDLQEYNWNSISQKTAQVYKKL